MKQRGTNQFPLKLLLANSGDLFNNGPDVASDIAKLPQTGPGSVAAVIGISQSRANSRTAFEKMSNIPVIGGSMYGNHMTDGEANFFMVGPPDDLFAKTMATWARNHGHERGYSSAVIAYDPKDRYFSNDLHDSLQRYLPAEEFALVDDEIIIGEQDSSSDTTQSTAKKMCDYAINGTLPVLTGRADQLRALFTDADNEPACKDHNITILAGPGAIVDVASGEVSQHSWLTLAYTALAKTAAESDEATGGDALRAASEAINNNAFDTGNNPSAIGVLRQLSKGFTVNGKTGTFTVTKKDHKDPTSARIQILETRPNS